MEFKEYSFGSGPRLHSTNPRESLSDVGTGVAYSSRLRKT